MNEYELIVVNGINKGSRYALNREFVSIGRGADNHIVLEDELVSRHHCSINKLSAARGKYEIKDLGSTNRTLINGSVAPSQELSVGDRIQVGSTTFVFTTIKGAESFLDKERGRLNNGTRLITVTEMKISADENKLLDNLPEEYSISEMRKAHRDLVLMYKLGSLINSIRDTGELLNALADRLVEVLRPSRVVIMLFGKNRGKIIKRVIRSGESCAGGIEDISMSIIHESVSEGMAILSYDALADERFKDKQSVIINKIRSVMCAPIKSRDDIMGAIYADTSVSMGEFSEGDLQFLSIIGNQAGVSIQNAKLYEDMDDLFTGALRTLVATIEAKDSVTSGHSIRVTAYSQAIAEEMILNKEALRILKISSLLHDIGKIGVPESILGKPAPLSENEYIRMKEHPQRGAEIIKNIRNVQEVVKAVRHHHERYDGKGLPDGLKGEKIPLLSRIIAVADTFDAMTFDRPYRKAVAFEKAVDEIKNNSGTQFDPVVVQACLAVYKKGMLNNVLRNKQPE